MGMFDVTGTPENPRVIEFEAFSNEGETMHIVPWVYPEHVTWRDKHEKRPGITPSPLRSKGGFKALPPKANP